MTISAELIARSENLHGLRLTTLRLRYPKFIHGEFMTHRMFSRNASSSRAIPVERLIADVLNDPAIPVHWGRNQPGMQAREECNELIKLTRICDDGEGLLELPVETKREDAWLEARDRAVHVAEKFAAAGYHKQIVNRLLEPFCHITVVATSTDYWWYHFLSLREHADAQPDMRELARNVSAAILSKDPAVLSRGEWHLPFVTTAERALDVETDKLIKVSVARCARVSYLTHDQKAPSITADLALYDRLATAEPPHLSPMEHQAMPDRLLTDGRWEREQQHGNLRGWVQYRKMFEEAQEEKAYE